MLAEIGADSIDDLFSAIPAEYRLTRDLDIPRQYAESEIVDFFRARAAESAQGYVNFLGAGAYSHYRPVVIDSLVSRGEWFTAYTPYQPEISQGTLQAIFEFQSMICELTGMDVANASMYDGSTGSAEALMMAERVTGRRKSIIATTVHPEYREVFATYARYQGTPIANVGYGKTDASISKRSTKYRASTATPRVCSFSRLTSLASSKTSPQSPTSCTRRALLCVSIAEAVSGSAL